MWEHFAHGADIGIRGRGTTRDEAFADGARALTAIVTDPNAVAPQLSVPIRCEAPDDELLLVAWLNAVIYEMARLRSGDAVVLIHCGSRGLGHQIGTDDLRDMVIAAAGFGLHLPDRPESLRAVGQPVIVVKG